MTQQAEWISPDAHVDEEIAACLDLHKPKSFFLFAGAGSGKTHSLTEALKSVRKNHGDFLRIRKQRVAVITYTKAASEVVKSRIGLDKLFEVSTIHSFIWELIRPFQKDIRNWVQQYIENEICEKESELASTKNKLTKTYKEKQRKVNSYKNRLKTLDSVKLFTYNPNGENQGRDSLNHNEVIEMGAYFLGQRELMKAVLVQKFPILLVDESQDTNKNLIEAFFGVEASFTGKFSLGLFGDMMQRIYFDGKENLSTCVPSHWEKPQKVMNYRCPKRVIRLINAIRADVDGIEQQSKPDKEEGCVRLFIVQSENANRQTVEQAIMQKMAVVSGDTLWNPGAPEIKKLMLEHHMAASRMGFLCLFAPLQKVDRYRVGLLDGSLSGLNFFRTRILPIVKAHRIHDDFAIAQVAKEYCSALDRNNLRSSLIKGESLSRVHAGIQAILELWNSNADPCLGDVLKRVKTTAVFEIPAMLEPFYGDEPTMTDKASDEEQDNDLELAAWNDALLCSFSALEKYDSYISGNTPFATHQGVKGLEFDRVMVIMDDEEARGFQFSYEKLFGVKELSDTDHKNQNEGKETGIDRTTRLIYVTCSRAEKSLVLVAYTSNPSIVKQHALQKKWFSESEIEVFP